MHDRWSNTDKMKHCSNTFNGYLLGCRPVERLTPSQLMRRKPFEKALSHLGCGKTISGFLYLIWQASVCIGSFTHMILRNPLRRKKCLVGVWIILSPIPGAELGARLLSTILLIHLSQILASTFCLFCQTMALKNLSICALEIDRTSIKILSPGYHWMRIMRFMQKYLHGH